MRRGHKGTIHWTELQCQYPSVNFHHMILSGLRPRKSRSWTFPILIRKQLDRIRHTVISYIKLRHQDGLQLVPLPKALWNRSHETIHTRTSKFDHKKVGLDPMDRVLVASGAPSSGSYSSHGNGSKSCPIPASKYCPESNMTISKATVSPEL